MTSFLMWLSARLPVKVIKDGDQPYLERYYLGRLFGTTFYLHRFVASDPDRGLHDHPWSWAWSLVLAGWYLEERRGFDPHPAIRRLDELLTAFDGKPRDVVRTPVVLFNRLRGDTFHRVVVPDSVGEVWTLFAHGPKVKPWGFLRPMPNAGSEAQLQLYVRHVDRDASEDSAAWAETAPKGKEIRHA